MTEVKICGVRDAAAMDAVAEAGADWVGFVFFPPSPRAVTPEMAAGLASRHRVGLPAVGLFVEPTDADIEAVLARVPLAALQVYAAEPRAGAIRARFGLPVWRGVGVAEVADLPASSDGIDRLLLDHRPGPGATLPGGNAQTFDWSVLRDWRAPCPWMLAGGLTPDNVATAVRQTGAPAVDVSSGVERSRGVKDPVLIAAFVAAVREDDIRRAGAGGRQHRY